MVKDPHKHHFKALELARITMLDNKRYNGSAGDKAIIYRCCDGCKEKQAFEYGETKRITERYEQLLKAQNGQLL